MTFLMALSLSHQAISNFNFRSPVKEQEYISMTRTKLPRDDNCFDEPCLGPILHTL